MGVINRAAQGFLDLVDAQTQGRSPPAFVDAVAPTVDLSQFYLADVLGYYDSEENHTGPGVINTMTVGDDEIWRVRGLSVEMPNASSAAAEQWAVRLSRAPRQPENTPISDGSPWIWMSGVDLMGTTTSARDVVRAIWFPEPLVMLPGNALLWELLQRDGGAIRASRCFAVLDILRR